MGETKIKIDLSQGLIEAEGNEDFVKLVYYDFKDKLQGSTSVKTKGKTDKKTDQKQTQTKPSKSKKDLVLAKSQIPRITKELDLSGDKNKSSLREFYKGYSPKSYQEKNLIFCYYLQEIIKQIPIDFNHVFTCYRNIAGLKSPGNIIQSLKDTAHRKGWLNTSSLNAITVPIVGINWLEHDIVKAGDEADK